MYLDTKTIALTAANAAKVSPRIGDRFQTTVARVGAARTIEPIEANVAHEGAELRAFVPSFPLLLAMSA